MFQCVCEPTFQKASYESDNILDLIITNDRGKISSIVHSAPLGNVKHGHHLLKCCYVLNEPYSSNESTKSTKLNQKGNYKLFSMYFDNVDWETEFNNKSINETYDIFLYHYNYANEQFIPTISNNKRRSKDKWITPELKTKLKNKNKICRSYKLSGWDDELIKAQYNKLKTEIKNKK